METLTSGININTLSLCFYPLYGSYDSKILHQARNPHFQREEVFVRNARENTNTLWENVAYVLCLLLQTGGLSLGLCRIIFKANFGI